MRNKNAVSGTAHDVQSEASGDYARKGCRGLHGPWAVSFKGKHVHKSLL